MDQPEIINVRAGRNLCWDKIEVYFHGRDNSNREFFSGKLLWEKVDPGSVTDPLLRLSRDTAQSLIDELWSAGMRPTESYGSAGALAATQEHLKDMQKLVFNFGVIRRG